jgi:predicted helicase
VEFETVLTQFRADAANNRDLGDRFERLMANFIRTYPVYDGMFKDIWLWREFPYRLDLNRRGTDFGIDIILKTHAGDYWAVQCKCLSEGYRIDRKPVDSFLAASGKKITEIDGREKTFSDRLWISTSDNWSGEARDIRKDQTIKFHMLGLADLKTAPVDWEKLLGGVSGREARIPRKTLRDHQKEALDKAAKHYSEHDRGLLVMSCGTGKTLSSLRIAEQQVIAARGGDGNGLIIFFAPSIALIGQTLKEWCGDAEPPIHSICVCSDADVSRADAKKALDENLSYMTDLPLRAVTEPAEIINQLEYGKANFSGRNQVIFSTYQSIDKVQETLKRLRTKADIVVCDEAHRTTGVDFMNPAKTSLEISRFRQVHDDSIIPAGKRLYMTATPRIYGTQAKITAENKAGVLCSMDDISIYGHEFHRLEFGEAVDRNLLSDYKVLVLAVNRSEIPEELQDTGGTTEIDADDITRLVGCVNALSKNMTLEDKLLIETDPGPMRKAVAFCETIKKSKAISEIFNTVQEKWESNRGPDFGVPKLVKTYSRHIDGTMGAFKRDEQMSWLKSDAGENSCHILTNVRCLSEGIDVTTLDAVMFLSAKNSQIEVVQSVGRVMRKAPGKKFGYIIIPIVIPAHSSPETALDNNKTFETIWAVLNALKAHDDRFQSVITKLQFNKRSSTILVGSLPRKKSDPGLKDGTLSQIQRMLDAEWEKSADLHDRIYAKMVKKVGNRHELALWAKDVAEIAEGFKGRITEVIAKEGPHKEQFDSFLDGLRQTLNPSVDTGQAVEMLAQHLITKPVFDALFGNSKFVEDNPVSQSLEAMIVALEDQGLEKDRGTLLRFYHMVCNQVSEIDSYEDRQKVIINLYDNFFEKAMPDAVKRLGIVYTPVEAVDFINRSVAKVLEKEFGRSISDPNVHILDPFAGTGTFLVRMIQSGLLGTGKTLQYKYQNDLHANEIMLLAYYIGNINIENAYHEIQKNRTEYLPFGGICLTDTFQLLERDEGRIVPVKMIQNSNRVKTQLKAPIVVIIGNPPYSAKQGAANDNLQNQPYPTLDQSICDTYAEKSKLKYLKIKNPAYLYDSYIRAFRWASNRLKDEKRGIIGFISNAGWLERNTNAVMRKCLADDFSKIYVFNLRGDCNTTGLKRQLECENIFGEGTKTPVSINILIKDSDHSGPADIFYHDVGDCLSSEEKLGILSEMKDIYNPDLKWETITPNMNFDWINQRNCSYSNYIVLGDKLIPLNQETFFSPIYSRGLETARDSWCYNFSLLNLRKNLTKSIDYYNNKVNEILKIESSGSSFNINDLLEFDSTIFSWDDKQKNMLTRLQNYRYTSTSEYTSLYRPFMKTNVYLNFYLNNRIGNIFSMFPTQKHANLIICIQGIGVKKDFSCIITDIIPDLNLESACQCFPMYYYEKMNANNNKLQLDTHDKIVDGYIRHEAVTDYIHKTCNEKYGFIDIIGKGKPGIKKNDIFYYVYGILHSESYKETFTQNLKKEMPRIPLLETIEEFQLFSKAGRDLAKLHVGYESVKPYKGIEITGAERENFTVEKMKFLDKNDKSTIVYNRYIMIKGIPSDAYKYIVNGNSAIEWIMDRYQVTINSKTQIRNDPNDWAKEHNEPQYILDLLLKVITVSLETVKIVAGLSKVKF